MPFFIAFAAVFAFWKNCIKIFIAAAAAFPVLPLQFNFFHFSSKTGIHVSDRRIYSYDGREAYNLCLSFLHYGYPDDHIAGWNGNGDKGKSHFLSFFSVYSLIILLMLYTPAIPAQTAFIMLSHWPLAD